MRRLLILVCLAAAAALLGCGGGSDETTAPPPTTAAAPAEVRAEWEKNSNCTHPQGASRWGCSVGPYRCQAVAVDRGWSVDCAKPGRSIAFTVPPRK